MKKMFWFSLLFLIGLAILSFAAPYFAPYSPNDVTSGIEKSAPSWQHLCGTDELGRDIFSRILYGGRISLTVGFSATLASLAIGTVLGVLAGFFRGKIDLIIQFLTDLTLAFPMLLLAIGIAVVLPPGPFSIILCLTLVGWAPFTRLIRSKVLELREHQFVEAAQSLGMTSFRIMWKHLIPNLGPVLIVTAAMKVGGFILTETSLSFLGLGTDLTAPSWGSMVYLGLDYIRYQPWIAFFPGLAIFFCVSAFNLLGEALEKPE